MKLSQLSLSLLVLVMTTMPVQAKDKIIKVNSKHVETMSGNVFNVSFDSVLVGAGSAATAGASYVSGQATGVDICYFIVEETFRGAMTGVAAGAALAASALATKFVEAVSPKDIVAAKNELKILRSLSNVSVSDVGGDDGQLSVYLKLVKTQNSSNSQVVKQEFNQILKYSQATAEHFKGRNFEAVSNQELQDAISQVSNGSDLAKNNTQLIASFVAIDLR